MLRRVCRWREEGVKEVEEVKELEMRSSGCAARGFALWLQL